VIENHKFTEYTTAVNFAIFNESVHFSQLVHLHFVT